MQIFREIAPLRAFLVEKRLQGMTVGFVPTMGALHDGHISLVSASLNENDTTVCSIFVNPTQFNNPADLLKYPRTLDSDTQMLEKVGCQALFCPEVETLYENNDPLRFDFGPLERVMEGEFRPGHFSGVALVVSKLFHIVEPHVAYFGQKDWQQCAVVKKLVQELMFPLTIKTLPTVREPDGLALSSRNKRLTPAQRKKSLALYQSLLKARQLLLSGEKMDAVKRIVRAAIEKDTEVKLEYIELADSENLMLLNSVEESDTPIICIAAYVGEVRLIDNLFV